jgi:toxin ParE1/3/4
MVQNFGELQARKYADTLVLTIEALAAGPDLLGIKKRDEIAPGIWTLHVARDGRKGRHFVVLRRALIYLQFHGRNGQSDPCHAP